MVVRQILALICLGSFPICAKKLKTIFNFQIFNLQTWQGRFLTVKNFQTFHSNLLISLDTCKWLKKWSRQNLKQQINAGWALTVINKLKPCKFKDYDKKVHKSWFNTHYILLTLQNINKVINDRYRYTTYIYTEDWKQCKLSYKEIVHTHTSTQPISTTTTCILQQMKPMKPLASELQSVFSLIIIIYTHYCITAIKH